MVIPECGHEGALIAAERIRGIVDTHEFKVDECIVPVTVSVGAAVIRGVAGLIELVPGIFLLPFETDIDALYDPADRGAALVEFENPLAEDGVAKWFPMITWNVRFGVTYTSAEY